MGKLRNLIMFSKKKNEPVQFYVGQETIKIEGRTLPAVALSHIGEALGWGMWIDETFQQQVVEAAKAGVKCYFTHGNPAKDSLGSYLGIIQNVKIVDGVCRGDLSIAPSADLSPEGELGNYVMQLAKDNPAACGLSLKFVRDRKSELEFAKKNTINGKFASPDCRNTENLPHVRLGELISCDMVGEPAANPDGLLSKLEETEQMAKIEELEVAFKDAKPEWLLAALKSNKSIEELKAEFSAMVHEEALKAKDAEINAAKAEVESLKKTVDELNKAVAEFKAKKEPVAFSAGVKSEGQPTDWKAAVQMIQERDKVSFADARAKLEVEFPALAMAVRTGK